jgi:ubiquinone/menaquinone biosynthesis C-methylase UbiE
MLDQNIKYFKDRVGEYEVSYLRYDEEYLVNRYFSRPGKMLVLGCGAGRTLPFLHRMGHAVTAIDIVPEMVSACREHTKDLQMDIREMDATKLQFGDGSFDYVFFPFHGIDCTYPDMYSAVSEAARVLKPGGTFIFNSHNSLYLKNFKNIFSEYFEYDGAKLYKFSPCGYFRLKKYFKEVKIKYRISMLDEKHANWKDKCYQLFPFFSNSIYFICKK